MAWSLFTDINAYSADLSKVSFKEGKYAKAHQIVFNI
jgi:hypothetical protein